MRYFTFEFRVHVDARGRTYEAALEQAREAMEQHISSLVVEDVGWDDEPSDCQEVDYDGNVIGNPRGE